MKKIICALMATCALVACSNNSDLKKWMEDEQTKAKNSKKQSEPIVPPVFKKYDPPAYLGLVSFDPRRMEVYRISRMGQDEDLSQTNEDKTTQFLTTVLIDKLAYKGMMDFRPYAERCTDSLCQGESYKPCRTPRACFALIKDKDTQKTYKVTVGDAMGQSQGIIKEIGARGILLNEKERREDGEWTTKVTQIDLES